jgi:hypothetical protein
MYSAVSPMGGRESTEISDSESGSKEAIDVIVRIKRRGCSSGGGHSLGEETEDSFLSERTFVESVGKRHHRTANKGGEEDKGDCMTGRSASEAHAAQPARLQPGTWAYSTC